MAWISSSGSSTHREVGAHLVRSWDLFSHLENAGLQQVFADSCYAHRSGGGQLFRGVRGAYLAGRAPGAKGSH